MVYVLGAPIPGTRVDLTAHVGRMATVPGRVYETEWRLEKGPLTRVLEFLGIRRSEADIATDLRLRIQDAARRAGAKGTIIYWIEVDAKKETAKAQWSIVGTPPIPVVAIIGAIKAVAIAVIAIAIALSIMSFAEIIRLMPPIARGAIGALGVILGLGIAALVGWFIWTRIIKPVIAPPPVAPPPPQKR